MKLKRYKQSENLSYADLADMIGLDRTRAKDAERYCKGTTIPGKKIMLRIFEATNGAVTPNDFFDLSTHTKNLANDAKSPAQDKAVDLGWFSHVGLSPSEKE